MPDETKPPKKRGCFFYGCLSLVVVFLIGAVLSYVAIRYAINSANKLIADYTDTAPVALERVEISADRLKELQQRVANFKTALDQQDTAQELSLSAADLNALIWNDPMFKDVKGKLFVMLEDDRIKGKVSLPLDNFGPFKLKGRYLNGTAAFKVSLQDGFLLVRLDDMEVKGKPLPATLLTQLKNENLAQNARRDPETAKVFEKFANVQIKDGKISLRSKGRQSTGP